MAVVAPPVALTPLATPSFTSDPRKLAAYGDLPGLAALQPAALAARDDAGLDALSAAARAGRAAAVTFLLEHDADPEARTAGGLRPLHHAALSGSDETVRALLSATSRQAIDVNSVDAAGNSALHYASSRGSLPIAQLLVEHRADVNIKNAAGATPLHLAANAGHAPVIAFLAAPGRDAEVLEVDRAGNSALHLAARCGHLAAVRALLAAGARSSTNRAGKAPLALAVEPAVVAALTAGATAGAATQARS